MKIFIYKLLVSLALFYVFFELTIGSRIDEITNKLNIFTDHQSRVVAKEKLKEELKKAIEKENYLTEPIVQFMKLIYMKTLRLLLKLLQID